MNRIDPRVPIAAQGQAQNLRPAGSGAAFILPNIRQGTDRAGMTARAGRTHATAFAAPLDTLMALQATDHAADRKKRQTRRGRDLLDGLDQLKSALLCGQLSTADLDRLNGTLKARREATDDPRLDDILAHIELRAAVELAKLGRTV
jgi:Class II flagellar assembly regulator